MLLSGVVAERVKVLLNVPVFTGLPEVSLNFKSISGVRPDVPLPPPLIVTVETAVKLPEVVVTVMVDVPEATPVTTPLLLTVATAVLLEPHVTV